MLHMLLLCFAFVCFVLASISVQSGRINLVAAGLAFITLSLLLGYRL